MRPSEPEEMARRTSGLRNAAATPWRSRAASLSSMLCDVSAAMTSSRSTGAANATDGHAPAISAAHRNSFPACILGLPSFGADRASVVNKSRGRKAALVLTCARGMVVWFRKSSCDREGHMSRFASNITRKRLAAGGILAALLCTGAALWPQITAGAAPAGAAPAVAPTGDWRGYGYDATGRRFSPLTQINASNVSRLRPVWKYGIASGGGDANPCEPLGVDDRGRAHHGGRHPLHADDPAQHRCAGTGDRRGGVEI